MSNKIFLFFYTILVLFSPFVFADQRDTLRIATTTSTENSGLLAILHPPFEQQFNARLDVIAVGTGKALKLGENGDVDVVFVHAPKAELDFIEAGFGLARHAVMHNDFIIVGPADDPAKIKQMNCLTQALAKIQQSQSIFISRGDDSGTHKKELSLWKATNLSVPSSSNYLSVGQGMGAVLRIADDKQAYTLTDRGTFLSQKNKLELVILFEGDLILFNPYHVIMVNPARHSHVNIALSEQYIKYLTWVEAQKIIANYQLLGEQLFYPDAITGDTN